MNKVSCFQYFLEQCLHLHLQPPRQVQQDLASLHQLLLLKLFLNLTVSYVQWAKFRLLTEALEYFRKTSLTNGKEPLRTVKLYIKYRLIRYINLTIS